MINNIFSNNRAIALLACVSVVSMLAACGTPDGGYYNKQGNYVPTDTPYNIKNNKHSSMPGGNPNAEADRENNRSEYPRYTRRGYYDYNGYYMDKNSGLSVPRNMFPPRGMCRVWFPERMGYNEQPAVESCDGIKYRVPAGAYVIYGG